MGCFGCIGRKKILKEEQLFSAIDALKELEECTEENKAAYSYNSMYLEKSITESIRPIIHTLKTLNKASFSPEIKKVLDDLEGSEIDQDFSGVLNDVTQLKDRFFQTSPGTIRNAGLTPAPDLERRVKAYDFTEVKGTEQEIIQRINDAIARVKQSSREGSILKKEIKRYYLLSGRSCCFRALCGRCSYGPVRACATFSDGVTFVAKSIFACAGFYLAYNIANDYETYMPWLQNMAEDTISTVAEYGQCVGDSWAEL